MLYHKAYGTVTMANHANNQWVGPGGRRYGQFVDKIGQMINLPLESVFIR